MGQQELFGVRSAAPHGLHGPHGPRGHSGHSVRGQGSALVKVRDLMLDGEWRTLGEIALAVGHSEAGCSARLRDLRRHGYTVEMRARAGNLNEYHVVKYFAHESD